MQQTIISKEEATRSMLEFITAKLAGAQDIQQQGNIWVAKKDDLEVVLQAETSALRTKNFLKEVKERSQSGKYTALILLRSTRDYDGEFLRQAVYMQDGRNRYYTNKKVLTAFEQALVDLFGSPIAYYNPSKDQIQLVKFIRYKEVPEELQPAEDSQESEQPIEVRRQRHILESQRERIRKIAIAQEIDGSFTLDLYERKRRKLARIIPYNH